MIQNGIYTIQYPNGDHRTLRFDTMRGGGWLAGKQKAAFLGGSDNEADYVSVGHFDENGQFRFWQRAGFDEIRQQRFLRAIEIIRTKPDETGRAYAMNSGRCFRCNRTLTHPDSLTSGLGPECRGKRNRTAAQRRLASVAA